jgi:hypothetical protein
MHAIVLSLVIATQGAGFEGSAGFGTASCCDTGGYSDCGNECGGGCGGGKAKRCSLGPCGPMPQTCYSPRYGCYPGNNRHLHRYPAFHGTYYRRPYNYRNVFDYPWHAELHEPTSLFTYNVEGEDDGADGDDAFDFGAASARSSRSFGNHPRGVPASGRR